MKTIDIHTHVYDQKIYDEYLVKADGRVEGIIIMAEDRFCDFGELLEFAAAKDNLWVAATVDTDKDIASKLAQLEKLFQEDKIVGIKLYPGYEYFYPSDKKIYPIAELCQKYNQPLIFHSGDVWSQDGSAMLKFAHPMHIDELAVKFPDCKIVIAHFGFPHHLETANIVSKNANVYTDMSGTIDKSDTAEQVKALYKQYLKDLRRVFNYFPDVKEKVMFGTDFGGEDTPLTEVQSYIKLIEELFSESEREIAFSKTAQKVFFDK